MGFAVYDYREDIRNILVAPQIRARFLRMEVGQVNQGHTHDLGHEVFLILQGQCEFEIEGHKEVLGPGQLCIARAGRDNHICRNVGDEPVIMYLSVTPHIQPTHTLWGEDGTKLPLRFNPSTAYDVSPDKDTPTDALADRQLVAAEILAAAVKQADLVQHEQLATLKDAIASGDMVAAKSARDEIWAALCPMFQSMFAVAEAWNELTYRMSDPDF